MDCYIHQSSSSSLSNTKYLYRFVLDLRLCIINTTTLPSSAASGTQRRLEGTMSIGVAAPTTGFNPGTEQQRTALSPQSDSGNDSSNDNSVSRATGRLRGLAAEAEALAKLEGINTSNANGNSNGNATDAPPQLALNPSLSRSMRRREAEAKAQQRAGMFPSECHLVR
jgi:hypothetical protein